jgi:hypothetical protein
MRDALKNPAQFRMLLLLLLFCFMLSRQSVLKHSILCLLFLCIPLLGSVAEIDQLFLDLDALMKSLSPSDNNDRDNTNSTNNNNNNRTEDITFSARFELQGLLREAKRKVTFSEVIDSSIH